MLQQADFSLGSNKMPVLLLLTMPLSPKKILILRIIGLTAMTPLWHSQVMINSAVATGEAPNPVETNMKFKGGRNVSINIKYIKYKHK